MGNTTNDAEWQAETYLREARAGRCGACVAEAFAITSARDPHTCGLTESYCPPAGTEVRDA